MKWAGSTSWSLSVDGGGGELDAVLWVRDVFALPVPGAFGAPPRLSNAPLRRGWPGGTDTHLAAGEQWGLWWADLTQTLTASGDHASIADPTAALLLGRPELRVAVDAAWAEAVQATRRPLGDVREAEQFPHPLLVSVVDDIVFDTGVDRGRLHGRITVVRVPPPWWSPTGPGQAVAAAGVTGDPVVSRRLVHTVLVSSTSKISAREA